MAAPAAATTTPDARFLDALGNNMAMINGRFDLPDNASEVMNAIREAVDECSMEIYMAVVASGKVKYDSGAIIHVVQLLQQVKNRACDAVILPHGPGAAYLNTHTQKSDYVTNAIINEIK
jgi:hypothetical protein